MQNQYYSEEVLSSCSDVSSGLFSSPDAGSPPGSCAHLCAQPPVRAFLTRSCVPSADIFPVRGHKVQPEKITLRAPATRGKGPSRSRRCLPSRSSSSSARVFWNWPVMKRSSSSCEAGATLPLLGKTKQKGRAFVYLIIYVIHSFLEIS